MNRTANVTRQAAGGRGAGVPRNDRRAELAEIHVLKGRLGLSDDEYRDLMSTLCAGVRSAAELDATARQRYLAHLRLCARERGMDQAGRAPAQRTVRQPLTPTQKRMWAAWMQLADAGLVHSRSMAALAAFAQRQTGVARIEWLNGHQQALVIESLKRWLASRTVPPARVEAAGCSAGMDRGSAG